MPNTINMFSLTGFAISVILFLEEYTLAKELSDEKISSCFRKYDSCSSKYPKCWDTYQSCLHICFNDCRKNSTSLDACNEICNNKCKPENAWCIKAVKTCQEVCSKDKHKFRHSQVDFNAFAKMCGLIC
uniref:Hypotheticial protein n=1 Tax=Schistosoma japonicum TaxID=6182 RepID=C7TYM0_SCHJA|nr:hypotheticial protein [Schistosoma japonicum]